VARHTAKSHKIRKVEILVIQIVIFRLEKNAMAKTKAEEKALNLD